MMKRLIWNRESLWPASTRRRFVLLIVVLITGILLSGACKVPGDDDDEQGAYLWMIGEVNNWSMKNPVPLTNRGDGTFLWEGYLPIGLLGFSGDAKPVLGGTWYGPEENGVAVSENGLPMILYQTSYYWRITTPGTYTINVNISGRTVSFTPIGEGGEEPGGSNPGEDKGLYGAYYEIFVGSFYDSGSDKMGDLKGIIQKLDYLNDGNPESNTSLHVDGLWLMPIMPSPTYHKYDVTDYCAIDSAYGTMKDFEDLITACNSRGIKVIIDLVMNHSSTQHPWFVAARNGDTAKQAYYNISSTKINNTYYALGSTGKYYEAVFWDQMPDLNFDNEAVKNEFKAIADFWLAKGVAGFRLDAVKHVYNDEAKNIAWLKWFTDYCKSKKSDVYIVGEVWSSDSEIINYYGSGVPSLFNFPFALGQGGDYIRTYVNNTPAANFATQVVSWNSRIRAKSAQGIDTPFLSNHDTNRAASFISDSAKLKMAAAMYLFMPGNPFIYYGEELGMNGSGIDENKRGPMIWSLSNTMGQTKGPSGMTYTWTAPNGGVVEQLANSGSLTRFYVDAIKLKNRYPVIYSGTLTQITTSETNYVAAYKVTGGATQVGLVHNLSDATRTVSITGALKLGGTLTASSTGGVPSLSGTSLTMPAYSTAVIEF